MTLHVSQDFMLIKRVLQYHAEWKHALKIHQDILDSKSNKLHFCLV